MSEETWPRTEAGTLQCPCLKAGKIFTILNTYEKDGVQYGNFSGFCSEEHMHEYKHTEGLIIKTPFNGEF